MIWKARSAQNEVNDSFITRLSPRRRAKPGPLVAQRHASRARSRARCRFRRTACPEKEIAMATRRVLAAAMFWAASWPAFASAQQLTFARDDFASVTGARAIVAGDFDRNGWPDVAQANTGRNSVEILLNHGGTLTKAFEIPSGSGRSPSPPATSTATASSTSRSQTP